MGMENISISLEEEIRDLIFDRLHIDYINKEEVDYDAPIFSAFDTENIGLGLDSVDTLELVVALRTNYALEINEEGMNIFKNIRTIADCIRSKKNEQTE